MAEMIYLSADGAARSKLNNALDDIQSALSKLQSAYSGMGKSYIVPNGDAWLVFDTGLRSQLGMQETQLENLEAKLTSFITVLSKAQEGLSEIDGAYRNKLSNSWWENVINQVQDIWAVILGGGSSASSSGVTTVPKEEDYEEIKNEFDWTETNVTQEEIDKAIEEARTEGNGKTTEDNIRSKLKELYENDPQIQYKRYREKVEIANQAVPLGEIQYLNWCTGCSRATMIQRKQALEGKTPNFTKEQEDEQNRESCWDHEYIADDGTTYSIKTGDGVLSENEMMRMLETHPEGIMIWKENSPNHAIVITDYEIRDDGSVQFYAYDPVNSRGDKGPENKGRVRLEDTWHYEAGGTLDNYNKFSYIE